MKKPNKKFWVQHTAIVIGTIFSIILLTIFLIFQYNQSGVLELESRWLLVAGVPILAALIIGGYIKSFKGFGIELEARLNKPVANMELSATVAMEEILGDAKSSIQYLDQLSPSSRRRISRLVLIQGRSNYYTLFALEQYLLKLKSLKYIEISNSEGKFLALIPISIFMQHGEINSIVLGEFIHALEQSQVLQRYKSSLITSHISEDTRLIESLRVMHRKNTKELAVLDENEEFLGLLRARAVEKRIVDNVLTAKENA